MLAPSGPYQYRLLWIYLGLLAMCWFCPRVAEGFFLPKGNPQTVTAQQQSQGLISFVISFVEALWDACSVYSPAIWNQVCPALSAPVNHWVTWNPSQGWFLENPGNLPVETGVMSQLSGNVVTLRTERVASSFADCICLHDDLQNANFYESLSECSRVGLIFHFSKELKKRCLCWRPVTMRIEGAGVHVAP